MMAHELSHVALRHGTAQATKGQKYQIGSVLGQIAGAIIGGTAGSIISQGTQFGLGATFLKYSREYESQADILGAQILARAGTTRAEMANMFKTIEAEGGARGPEWLSSHPNPGNRYEAINREAGTLRVQGNANTGQFQESQGATALDAACVHGRANREGPGEERSAAVEHNARAHVSQRATAFFAVPLVVSVPVPAHESAVELVGGQRRRHWHHLRAGRRLCEADGKLEGVTHGFQIGVTSKGSGNLQRDTDQLVSAFAQSNPQLRRQRATRAKRSVAATVCGRR